jgi:hypothetical protein
MHATQACWVAFVCLGNSEMINLDTVVSVWWLPVLYPSLSHKEPDISGGCQSD